MTHLSAPDVERLLACIGDCYEFREQEAFQSGVLPALRRLVPCEIASYNEVEVAEASFVWRVDPPGSARRERRPEVFAVHAAKNPLIVHFQAQRDGRAYKWSDFVSRREVHATDLYKLAYQPLGVEFQMAFVLPSAPELIIGESR